MADWTPPPVGAPCWTQITAYDVARAKTFYSSVFNWDFRALEGKPESDIVGYSVGKHVFTGGIVKAEGEKVPAKGGVVIYLWVENLKDSADLIVKHEGKLLCEPTSEGGGSYIDFEDTEGNVFGIYEVDKKK